MAIEQYAQDSLLFNMNFKSNTSKPGVVAYRGELVLIEGEIADAQGRRKPPLSVMRHAVLLEQDSKLIMSAGFVDKLDQIKLFIEKYQADFAAGMRAMFFVVNITKPMLLDINGMTFVLIPLVDGVTWNQMCDEMTVEKVDLKGQSSADKVVTLYHAFSDYQPKYDAVTSMEEAMTFTADIKREGRGPV